jgi:hypothetical protein
MNKHMKFGCAVATLALAAPCTSAQEVLVAIGGPATNPIGQALRDLDIDFESGLGAEDFLVKLRGQQWDLVVVHTLNRFLPDFEADILDALTDHVDSGGALHFQIADLENLPDGWYDLLGLEGAVDLELPLSEIRTFSPRHPSVVTGGIGLADERYPLDYGDVLVPATGSYVVAFYEADMAASTVIGRDGLVLVNGQQWDNWAGGSRMARDELSWLLSCPADLDGDGDLTVFDFLEFQNLFNLRDVRADVFYDGRFDVFDFLEFFNQFEIGCG